MQCSDFAGSSRTGDANTPVLLGKTGLVLDVGSCIVDRDRLHLRPIGSQAG